MKLFYARVSVLSLTVLWPFSHSFADTNIPACHITAISQWADQATALSTDCTAVNICGSTCNFSTNTFYVYTASGKPTYASLMPFVMGAFLYNKQITLSVSGASCQACMPTVTVFSVLQ